jgi:hypothetical protein
VLAAEWRCMDRQRILALFFTLIMILSSVAYAFALL